MSLRGWEEEERGRGENKHHIGGLEVVGGENWEGAASGFLTEPQASSKKKGKNTPEPHTNKARRTCAGRLFRRLIRDGRQGVSVFFFTAGIERRRR